MLLILIPLGLSCPSAHAGPVTSLDDIEFWVGTGANRSALVLDWQGNSTLDNALAWGFRWDGTATGADMFTAIVAADPRLYAKVGSLGGFGIGVFGLGYDTNGDGAFALDDDTVFDDQGLANSGPADGAESIDPEDFYQEGWLISGYWNYGSAATSPFAGGTWTPAASGISSRTLTNNSWDSLAFTPTYSNQAFGRNPLAAQLTANADFDGDDDIDGRDFLAWQRGFGTLTGALAEQGDANGDHAVDPSDLEIWSTQYGLKPLLTLASIAEAGGVLVVPEPSGIGMHLFAVSLCWPMFVTHFRFATWSTV